MKSYYVKVSEIIEGKAESPLPIEVIPNNMGINLCSVDAISWQKQDDGQLVNLSIHFLPAGKMFVDDGLLWQEIFSLREKLKIAVAAIKSYDPDFDDREFTHRLNSVDYDQLMEELADEGAKNTEQQLQPDTYGAG